MHDSKDAEQEQCTAESLAFGKVVAI